MEAQQSGMTDLAARPTKRLADANSNTNLVFSPLSIYAVLALLAAGAGRATLEEVLGARSRRELEDSVARLRDTLESGGPSVAFAYGVWSDLTRPIKPAYCDAVVRTYKAEAGVVDFLNDPEHATGQINAWAAEATRNLITSAVQPGFLHPDIKLVLANAIYFKGKWDLPFNKSQTENKPFYRLDGTAVNVSFMTNSDSHYISEHHGFKVLKLRYKSSPYTRSSSHHCMCIFLPDACRGLRSLLDKITSSPGFLREHLPQSIANVGQFWVPKFELSFLSSLTTVLKDLGLRLPFSPEADLSKMLEDDGSGGPFLHKAVIEVSEEGTKAAAVTMASGYTACPTGCRTPQVDFVADHPFAYFIIEEASDTVIFAVHVVDPTNGTGMMIPSPAPFQEYTTTKTKFDELNNRYQNQYHNVYGPSLPAYSHHPPVYKPTPPAYNPVSPVYRRASPQHTPISLPYRPTMVPFESNMFIPAEYHPTPPVYTELPRGVGQYRPHEMSSGGLSKATAAQAARRGKYVLPLNQRHLFWIGGVLICFVVWSHIYCIPFS